MSTKPDFEGFVRKLVDDWFPDAYDIDAGDFQNTAEKFGIIRPVPFDPDKHGPCEAEPGDTIYVRNY